MAKNFALLKQRYKILLNYFIGPVLFVLLIYSIYSKIKNQQGSQAALQLLKESLSGEGRWIMITTLLLMLLNWSLEARKWQLLIKPIQKVSLFTSIKAVLSGLSFSLFIPNGIGEYFGRLLYMNEGNRLRSVAVTFVGSMAQLIITLVAGTIGLFYLRENVFTETTQLKGLSVFWLNGLMYALIMAIAFFLVLYFRLSWFTKWFEKIPFVYEHRIFVQSLEDFHWRELTRILTLSAGRFVVFSVQYMLMLYLFKVNITWLNAVCTTSVLFLVLAIVPTIPIADVGIRGQVCVQLFGLFSANTAGIAFTAASIWIINIIIPSLAGSLFVLGIKFFRSK